MLTENGVTVDFEALNALLERADVLTIGFTMFPERLLIDTRLNATDGPMVAVVGPVATVEERYLWLGKHRSSFGAPEAFSFIVWPLTVRTLIETDAIAPMRARLEAAAPQNGKVLNDILHSFAEIERKAMRDAIHEDEGWATIWPRAG